MNYDMPSPCSTCPFRRGTSVQLTAGRVREITKMILNFQGGTFQCHNTIDYDKLREDQDEHGRTCSARDQKGAQHCAGALIFALKHNTLAQMPRIASRIGLFNPDKIMEDQAVVDQVYDNVQEMLADHKPRKVSA